MAQYLAVRPQLLDEAAILKAIMGTGLHPTERGLIVDMLVENYTVDLDLLQDAFASMAQPAAPSPSDLRELQPRAVEVRRPDLRRPVVLAQAA